MASRSLKDLARDAVASALRRVAMVSGVRRAEVDSWVRDGGRFVRHTWNRLVYRVEVLPQLLQLPEFRAFMQELRRDASFALLVDRYVGPLSGMGMVLHEVHLLNGLMPSDTDPVNPKNSMTFDEAEFSARFNALLHFRDAGEVPFVQLRPLIGLVCTEIVTIDLGLTIEPLSDEEIIEALT